MSQPLISLCCLVHHLKRAVTELIRGFVCGNWIIPFKGCIVLLLNSNIVLEVEHWKAMGSAKKCRYLLGGENETYKTSIKGSFVALTQLYLQMEKPRVERLTTKIEKRAQLF